MRALAAAKRRVEAALGKLEPVRMLCYCGRRFLWYEGYGCFCTKRCASSWQEMGHFNLESFEASHGKVQPDSDVVPGVRRAPRSALHRDIRSNRYAC